MREERRGEERSKILVQHSDSRPVLVRVQIQVRVRALCCLCLLNLYIYLYLAFCVLRPASCSACALALRFRGELGLHDRTHARTRRQAHGVTDLKEKEKRERRVESVKASFVLAFPFLSFVRSFVRCEPSPNPHQISPTSRVPGFQGSELVNTY